METMKDILNFSNVAIFSDYKKEGITKEMNQVRKCITKSFYKIIPYSRILISLSIVDDLILNVNCNDIENNIESVHDLRENVRHILSFEKLNIDEQQAIGSILIDDDDQQQSNLLSYKWLSK